MEFGVSTSCGQEAMSFLVGLNILSKEYLMAFL